METVFFAFTGLLAYVKITWSFLICYNIQETLNSWPLLSKGLSLPLMQQPPELITLVNACVYASCAAARLRSGPETALHGALLKIDILRIMASAVAVIYLKITHSFIVYFICRQTFWDVVVIKRYVLLRLDLDLTDRLHFDAARFMLSDHISTLCWNYSAYCIYKIQEVYISCPIFRIVTTKSLCNVYHCNMFPSASELILCIQCVHIYTWRDCNIICIFPFLFAQLCTLDWFK